MHHFIEWAKQHKLLAGISLVGIYVVYRIFAGSGSSTTGTTTQESSAQINADASLQAAQLQANTQVALGNISAGVAGQNITASQNVANNQISAGVTNTTTAGNVQLGVANIQGSVANNSTNATLQESLAQTSALEAIAIAPYQVELAQLNSQPSGEITDLEHQIANVAALSSSAIGNVSNEITTGNYPIANASSAGAALTSLNSIAATLGTTGTIPAYNTANGYTLLNTQGQP